MLNLILITLLDSFFQDYCIRFSYVEPRNEVVKSFVADLVKYPRENYEWNYIYLNMLATESNDTIVGVEYFKADDFYSRRPLDGEQRLYTIIGNDTIFIQGDLSLLFFMPTLRNQAMDYKIDGTNVVVEFVPSRLFHFSSWKFEEE